MELIDISDNQTNQKVEGCHIAKEHDPHHEDNGEPLTDWIICKMIWYIFNIKLSYKVLGR